MTANAIEILSGAEIDALSAPLDLPLSWNAWIEAEKVAKAFSEDSVVESTVGDLDRFESRQRVAARVRRAVRTRAGMLAKTEVESAGRRARAVFATLRSDR